MYPFPNHIDTQRVEEIPAKEPKPNAVPLKSALKKKSAQQGATTSSPATPVQETNNINGSILLTLGGGAYLLNTLGNNYCGVPGLTPTSVNSSGIIMSGGGGGGGCGSVNQRPLVVRQDATGSYNLK